jgi:hypothetical protein
LDITLREVIGKFRTVQMVDSYRIALQRSTHSRSAAA